MRCLGTFLLMCCMLIGGAVVVNVDPQLPGQVVAAGASGVGWVADALSRVGDPTSPPASPAPTAVPVTVVPEPPPSPTLPPTTTPTSSPTSTPSSPPSWTFSWSSQDRIWAVATLEWDQRLDTAAETTYPQFRGYYANWVADWVAALAAIQAFEAGVAPSAVQRADPPRWFATAIAAHQVDEQRNPGSAGWDNEWIGNYQRLERLWSAL